MMNPSKDYYHILGITRSATAKDIRKAFRKLAMQYHPDKLEALSASVSKDTFLEIQEAYQVLIDPKNKATYDYARYLQNPMRKQEPQLHSIEDIVALSKKIRISVSNSDPFRTDRDILFFEISSFLSDRNIAILQTESNESVNYSIVQNILSAAEPLPLFMAEQIITRLEVFSGHQPEIQKAIRIFETESKRRYYWNRYKVVIAAAVAILFCLSLYLSGRQ